MKKIGLSFFAVFIFSISFSQTTIIDTIISGGIPRNYRLYIPAAYTGSSARPLIINMHGYTSSAIAQQYYTNFMPIADTANFLMVYPNGTLLNGQPFWNAGMVSGGVDDIQFISNLIDTLLSQYYIDANCVYSTGMSNGGFMSYTLACALNTKITAIASVTGSMVTPQYNSCVPNRTVPVMEIHGTADATVPYLGAGASSTTPATVNIDTLVNYWVNNNYCNTSPVHTFLPDINTTDGCTAEHFVYSGGNNNSSVELYKINGGGHTWPGAIFNIGVTNLDFNASEKIWLFFRKYKLNQFVGINELATASAISIYPNPTYDLITIKGEGVIKVSIVDVTGKIVLESKQKQIDISSLAKGIYWVVLVSEKNNSIKKMVKL